MSDVFLSYARKDLAIAMQVAEHLGEQGLAVFWDREIPVGATWEGYIEEQLFKAKCVVVLWSSASVASDWVLAEATAAVERNVLVPASIDATTLPLRFRMIQTADLVGWNGHRQHIGLENLVAAVRSLAEVKNTPKAGWVRLGHTEISEKSIAIAEVETGKNRGRSLSLTEGIASVTIGRSRDCDFVLDDYYVSRSHCRIDVQPNELDSNKETQYRFTLIDSGSSAGTVVNGKRVERAELRSGDRFQIGTVRFRFRVTNRETA